MRQRSSRAATRALTRQTRRRPSRAAGNMFSAAPACLAYQRAWARRAAAPARGISAAWLWRHRWRVASSWRHGGGGMRSEISSQASAAARRQQHQRRIIAAANENKSEISGNSTRGVHQHQRHGGASGGNNGGIENKAKRGAARNGMAARSGGGRKRIGGGAINGGGNIWRKRRLISGASAWRRRLAKAAASGVAAWRKASGANSASTRQRNGIGMKMSVSAWRQRRQQWQQRAGMARVHKRRRQSIFSFFFVALLPALPLHLAYHGLCSGCFCSAHYLCSYHHRLFSCIGAAPARSGVRKRKRSATETSRIARRQRCGAAWQW